jgi:hypothetical protein
MIKMAMKIDIKLLFFIAVFDTKNKLKFFELYNINLYFTFEYHTVELQDPQILVI